MSLCASCGHIIEGTTKDPIVAASSLGAGHYHYDCAKEMWRKKGEKEGARREASRERRSRVMKERWAARKEVET